MSKNSHAMSTDGTGALLAPEEPPAFSVDRPDGTSPFVLTCDHGGKRIPRALGDLGVNPRELDRHIAWDRGVAETARALAAALDAPLVLQPYSRLVIDCNRPFAHPGSIPIESEDTSIPGNHDLSATEVETRRREIFFPYHEAVSGILDARRRARRPTILVALHSFTPLYRGEARTWDVGLLYQRDRRLSAALISELAAPGELCVGDNQPYQVDDAHDYGIPVHGEARGLLHALVEVRQDHLETHRGRAAWAERLATVLPRAGAAAHRKDTR